MRKRIWLWWMTKNLDCLIKLVPYLSLKSLIKLMHKNNQMLKKMADIEDSEIREVFIKLLGIQTEIAVALSEAE